MRARLLRRRAENKKVDFQGIPIVIEHRKGSTRNGVGDDGKRWERLMACDYGFIDESIARGDGEPVDVYLGDDADAATAYAIEQLKNGRFDETKLMIGFPSEKAAVEMYLRHYPAGWERNVGRVQDFSIEEIKEWIDEAHQ